MRLDNIMHGPPGAAARRSTQRSWPWSFLSSRDGLQEFMGDPTRRSSLDVDLAVGLLHGRVVDGASVPDQWPQCLDEPRLGGGLGGNQEDRVVGGEDAQVVFQQDEAILLDAAVAGI